MEPSEIAQKLSTVLDEQDAKRDELVSSQAPTGRFTEPRLKALVQSVNKALALVGAPDVVADVKITPGVPTQLPVDLVKGLGLIKNMIEDCNSEDMYAPLRSFEIVTAKTDADLAIITRAINEILASREFKKFLQAERAEPEVGIAPEDEVVEAPGQVAKPTNIDLMLLK